MEKEAEKSMARCCKFACWKRFRILRKKKAEGKEEEVRHGRKNMVINVTIRVGTKSLLH